MTPGWSLKLSREDTIRPSRSSIAERSGSRAVVVEESRSTESVSDVWDVWELLSESSIVGIVGCSDERRRDDIVAWFYIRWFMNR